jgi:peptidoglycan/LPS O-acetylase OafA/YrhL
LYWLSYFWFFTNDFDSLRLLDALQVAIFHGIEHLNHSLPHLLYQVLGYVPGVPIFFLLSGYLISSSWERCKTGKEYLVKRAARIFPAQWGCLVLTVLCIHVFSDVTWGFWPTVLWLVGQATFVQFYTPGFLISFWSWSA